MPKARKEPTTFDLILRAQPLKSNSEETFDEGAVAYQLVGSFDPRMPTDDLLKEPGRFEPGHYLRITWDGTFDERGSLMDLDTLRQTEFEVKVPKPRANVVTENSISPS